VVRRSDQHEPESQAATTDNDGASNQRCESGAIETEPALHEDEAKDQEDSNIG
jgi:hypothetical protein